jgi:hypothetical protein
MRENAQLYIRPDALRFMKPDAPRYSGKDTLARFWPVAKDGRKSHQPVSGGHEGEFDAVTEAARQQDRIQGSGI